MDWFHKFLKVLRQVAILLEKTRCPRSVANPNHCQQFELNQQKSA